VAMKADAERKAEHDAAKFALSLANVMTVLMDWQKRALTELPVLNIDKACLEILEAIQEGVNHE